MAAPVGNKFWMIRKTHGREPVFSSPEQMWDDCVGYFEWCEANPLIEHKPFAFQGVGFIEEVPKMRAMTLTGLCVYLGINLETWRDYRSKEDFSGVCTRVDQIIYDQKFTGAAADLLNASIIARDLGLSDKKDHTVKSVNMEIAEDTTPQDAANIYKQLMDS